MILVNLYLQLDTTSVVIFPVYHFSLPFTFVLVAKDFDLPSLGGILTNSGKYYCKFLIIFSAKIAPKL